MTEIQYIPIPLAEVEHETEIVRRTLRKYGHRLQQQGEIPAEASPVEINDAMEQYVPRIVRAVHQSPLYPHVRAKGPRLLARFVEELITQARTR